MSNIKLCNNLASRELTFVKYAVLDKTWHGGRDAFTDEACC